MNCQPPDHQQAREPEGDVEKLSVTFNHAWLILQNNPTNACVQVCGSKRLDRHAGRQDVAPKVNLSNLCTYATKHTRFGWVSSKECYQIDPSWKDPNSLDYLSIAVGCNFCFYCGHICCLRWDQMTLLTSISILSCEAFSVDVHVMPLGELFLGYFNNFRDTQEHITWKLLFQTDLHILLTNKTNIDTIGSLSNGPIFFIFLQFSVKFDRTRMHSSRMRTAHSLTISHCIRKNWKNHACPSK